MGKTKKKRQNLMFVPAAANVLQIDRDASDRSFKETQSLGSLTEMGLIVDRKVSMSRSGQGFHETIVLSKKLPIMERIALAAALGDDPVRVVLNWTRARAGDPHPILFLEKNK